MKKSDFKKQIKPIVKEVIHEVILESGIISKIVQEAMVGVKSAELVINERTSNNNSSSRLNEQQIKERQEKQKQQRKKLLDRIGREKFGGVDLFEGTTPIADKESSAYGPLKDVDVNDPGVDLSSLPGVKNWSKLV